MIGIVDGGRVYQNHSDLAGRVSGNLSSSVSNHATHVAGIAAAKGNNNRGIAGVDWNAQINTQTIGDIADQAAAIRDAIADGVDLINNSWGQGSNDFSITAASAFADAYKANIISSNAMPEDGSPEDYPNRYDEFVGGILNVAASTTSDELASYSHPHDYVDVAAPGGDFSGGAFGTDDIYSTVFSTYTTYGETDTNGGYDYSAGTSMAAPHVAGIASLLKGYAQDMLGITLYNDDIKNIIRLSAEDVNSSTDPGWDQFLGTGRVNARAALDLLRNPYVLQQRVTIGGADMGAGDAENVVIIGAPGLADNVYIVKPHEVERTVSFTATDDPEVWCRGVDASGSDDIGWSYANPNFATGYCEVIDGTVTSTSARLKTWVYEVFDIAGGDHGWHPATRQNVRFAYSVLGTPATLPDPPPSPTGLAISGTPGQHPHLTWNASTGADGYKVYQCANVSYLCSNFSYIGSTSNTYYDDTDETIGTTCGNGPDEITWYYVTAYNNGGESNPSNDKTTCTDASKGGVASGEHAVPEVFALAQNYPNPFNPSTEIRFDLPEAAHVRLVVYDVLGREVARLVDREMGAGYQRVTWNAGNVPSGVYLYRIAAGSFRQTRRMVLLK